MGADASELRNLSSRLTNGSKQYRVRAEQVVARTAIAIVGSARINSPVDTGALRNSISADIQGLTAEVGPTVDYATHVEHGTSRMAPQPFLGPAAIAHEPAFYAALERLGGVLDG